MKQIKVEINSIDDEGRGRAIYIHQDGQEYDVAVRGAFVGDKVLAKIERIFPARKLLVCRAQEFFDRSSLHTKRKCHEKGPCPTCPLHGVDASMSLELKRARIERALFDKQLDFEVDDVVTHPSEYGYRQRVKLMARMIDGKLRLGVYIPYTHLFETAESCPYVNEKINNTVAQILDRLNQLGSKPLAAIKAVLLRAGKDGTAVVLVTSRALCNEVIQVLQQCVQDKIAICVIERIQEHQTNSLLSGNKNRQIGASLIASLEKGSLVDPDSFCQSDPIQATRMYDLVAEYLTQDSSDGYFLDAYAGVGGFTKALQRRGCKKIIAIEQANSALVSLEKLNVEVLLCSTEDALSEIKSLNFEGIVVDPPKKGLMQAAKDIAELKAKRLVLVSCDPDSMAKDLTVLLRNGYQVKRILPIDFFGGTPAIETVVFLQKSD